MNIGIGGAAGHVAHTSETTLQQLLRPASRAADFL